MWGYLLKRGLGGLLTAIGAIAATFAMIRIAPGDPIEVLLGDMASTADIAEARQAYGLDQPIWQQFGVYLRKAASLDFGLSITQGTPVGEIVLASLPATLLLAATTMAITILVAVPLGIAAALHKGRLLEKATSAVSFVALSLPEFWLGITLILIFARKLRWLPSGGEGALALIMPAITLALPLIAVNVRLMTTETLNVLRAPYVTMARARGLGQGAIMRRHVVRNALIPVLTIGGVQFAHLLGGAVIVETVFNWPGIGQLLIRSISLRDYPVVQGCLILITASVIIINMLVDIGYRVIDPRFRTS